jgi:hypothetical protein
VQHGGFERPQQTIEWLGGMFVLRPRGLSLSVFVRGCGSAAAFLTARQLQLLHARLCLLLA